MRTNGNRENIIRVFLASPRTETHVCMDVHFVFVLAHYCENHYFRLRLLPASAISVCVQPSYLPLESDSAKLANFVYQSFSSCTI